MSHPRAEYQRQWHAAHPGYAARETARRYGQRRGWLTLVKMASGCIDCGYRGHPDALEFDHVRGEKLHNIGSRLALSMASICAEIEKCEVVCANCHRVRTATRRSA